MPGTKIHTPFDVRCDCKDCVLELFLDAGESDLPPFDWRDGVEEIDRVIEYPEDKWVQ